MCLAALSLPCPNHRAGVQRDYSISLLSASLLRFGTRLATRMLA